jgi:TPR repeat protein
VGGDIFQGNVVSAALKWSERAAEQGHVEAQLFTGMIYLKLADSLTETDQADGKSRLQKEGLRWIESAANGNVVAAQLRLGYVYMSGLHGAERDPKLCLKWIKAAANHGNARAIYLYSQLYQTLADEVSLSAIVEKTEELLLKAAEKGCAEAQFALGQKRLSVVLQNFEDDYQKALVAAHQSGDFEKSELWQAVSLIQKAARTSAKYPKAAFTMAHLLLDESRIYGEEEPQIECIAEAAQYLEKVILWEKSEETRTYAKQLLTSLTQQDQVRKRFIDQKIMFSYIKSRFGIKS